LRHTRDSTPDACRRRRREMSGCMKGTTPLRSQSRGCRRRGTVGGSGLPRSLSSQSGVEIALPTRSGAVDDSGERVGRGCFFRILGVGTRRFVGSFATGWGDERQRRAGAGEERWGEGRLVDVLLLLVAQQLFRECYPKSCGDSGGEPGISSGHGDVRILRLR
jgi:hypothetical protein